MEVAVEEADDVGGLVVDDGLRLAIPERGNGDAMTTPTPDEPPPFLGTWGRVYAAVVAYLILLIALFRWFTRAFAA